MFIFRGTGECAIFIFHSKRVQRKKNDVQCLGDSQEETECRSQQTSRVVFRYGVVSEECRTRV